MGELNYYEVQPFQVPETIDPSYGYTVGGWYPWDPSLTDKSLNLKVANIGQLKAVFSLRLDAFIWDPLEDADNNGLPDVWERRFGTLNPDGDADNDGLSNSLEEQYNTDPTLSDSDRDGITDFLEIENGFDPLRSDENNNGIIDGAEDFDSDGLLNNAEFDLGLDARNSDSDFDENNERI